MLTLLQINDAATHYPLVAKQSIDALNRFMHLGCRLYGHTNRCKLLLSGSLAQNPSARQPNYLDDSMRALKALLSMSEMEIQACWDALWPIISRHMEGQQAPNLLTELPQLEPWETAVFLQYNIRE